MVLVLVLAAALWGIGRLMGAPHSARWSMIGLLFVGVLALQIILPEGAALREATGGSLEEWLVLAGLAALVWAYSVGLGRLRSRVRPENRAAPSEQPRNGFQSTELERYARHIVLREIGGPGQKALKDSRVLVIGAGGLGSPALLYLAAAGVGTIGVIDDDTVEGTNLQRQVIHADARIGMPKVFSAEAAMKALNPWLVVRPYHRRLTEDIAAELFADYDLILDGCDSFETRYLANRTAAAAGIPLISGALSQWEAQVSLFDPARGTPCYQCIFPAAPAPHLAPSCAEAGVLGPLPGIAGSMMAAEAVKAITGAGEGLRGRMMIFDALYAEARVIGLKKRDGCPVCGG
ncbi:HesA/MoeB/ThiF family protein [Oceaniglobus roseus]|uniref:HesA/MoeB/ThiF family protein n=1 Tax=Oceaniglobus roseus TaxID=1737570 RepID=UPI000C7F755F|nr:molybdopterin-synthase adenylyltransferase MoeB [Kandeliimicrobium roseum]